MSELEQTPEVTPPPLPAHVARVREPFERLRGMVVLVALPGAAAICLQASLLSPDAKILGAAVAMMAFWIGFYRLPTYVVSLVLGLCILISLRNFPQLSVAILAASALAGAVGARLTRAEAEEDDFFFIPLLTAVTVMAVLITMGVGGGWVNVAGRVMRAMQRWVADMTTGLKAFYGEGVEIPDYMSNIKVQLTGLIIFGALAQWLAGRLARRLLGRLRGLHVSLIMFRIQVRYTFLLILGLILAIFSSLGTSDTFAYLAWPVLGVVALAGFLDGLGIVLFLAALRRMAGRAQEAFWLTLLGTATALLFGQFTALVGLADIWMDFRKLERLRQQMEAGAGHQKEE